MRRVHKRFALVLVCGLATAGMVFAAGGAESETSATGPTSLLIMQQLPASFVQEDNPVIAYIEEQTNLKLTYQIPPLQNYGEQQRLVIASGDLPDVMQFGGNVYDPVLLDAVDNGLVLPVTEWIKNAPNIQKWTNPISWKGIHLKNDEDIYAIPGNTIVRADGYMIRKDWLDAVGLELPSDNEVTIDQFTEILRRFTENDPDGNGEDDTYGMGVAAAGGNMYLVFGWPFGVGRRATEDWWQKVDGEAFDYMPMKYAKNHDNMIRALEYHRMLWEKGYVDKNWPANNGTTRNDRVWAGVVGGRESFGGHVFGNWLPKIQQNNPDAEATYIVGIKNDQGVVRGPGFGTGLFRINVVMTPGKEKPAVDYFDFLLSDPGFNLLKFGLDGIHYNMVDGKRVFTEEYNNYGWRTYLALVRRYNDPSFFIQQKLDTELQDIMIGWVSQCVENVQFSLDFGYRPPILKEQRFLDARDEIAVVISRIIAGQLDVDAWWDALDAWYEAGGEEYLEQVNEFIKANQ